MVTTRQRALPNFRNASLPIHLAVAFCDSARRCPRFCAGPSSAGPRRPTPRSAQLTLFFTKLRSSVTAGTCVADDRGSRLLRLSGPSRDQLVVDPKVYVDPEKRVARSDSSSACRTTMAAATRNGLPLLSVRTFTSETRVPVRAAHLYAYDSPMAILRAANVI